ncbi:MAG: hypothetical protein WCV73_04905 [Patescibacteria group bacterium]
MAEAKPKRNLAFDSYLTTINHTLTDEIDTVFRGKGYFLVKYDFQGEVIFITCSLSSLSSPTKEDDKPQISLPELQQQCVPGCKVLLIEVGFVERRKGGGYRATSAQPL